MADRSEPGETTAGETTPDEAGAPPRTVPLEVPADGLTPVVDSPERLDRVVAAFAAASGPIAADAERASGYRYGQRAYLVQLRREGAGTALIDPIALPDLSGLSKAVGDAEWILHAASQDLPGFAEVGLHPARVFDTELAARLLGMHRVGLAAVVAETLGLKLAKKHSAVDWSTRPLPADWLTYAALDVEVLIPLRDILADRLVGAGKQQWAEQEFEAERLAPAPTGRPDPWRRTSGVHALRDRRQLAVARSLWYARDKNARHRNLAPFRVLPDAAIVAAAKAVPRSVPQLTALPEFSGKATRRRAPLWQAAIDEALALPDRELPTVRGPHADGPPPLRAWSDRDPHALARFEASRAAMRELSERVDTPVENLLQPDALRRLCWTLSEPASTDEIAAFLGSRGARPWQIQLVADVLAAALAGVDPA